MRPDRTSQMSLIALVTSLRATCPRRKVGCVLTDEKGRVLATGYNGVPSGLPHCTEHQCPGAGCASGQGLELCQAVHAEQNALLQCRDPDRIDTAYITDSPCVTCVKLLLNSGCRHLVYVREYPHSAALQLWQAAGRTAEQADSEAMTALYYQLSPVLAKL